MKMKKVLITGGGGFIGDNLTKFLQSLGGWEVITLDVVAKEMGATNHHIQVSCQDFLLRHIYQKNTFPSIYDLVSDVGQGLDLVIHLAAIPRVSVSLKKTENVLVNNLESTIAICKYCTDLGVPLINISSSSVVWADTSKNPYALSKKMCESVVDMYTQTFGLRATTVRLFNVYGPGERYAGDSTTLLKKCQVAFETNSVLTINGDGSIVRDFTHVLDVCSGLLEISNIVCSPDAELQPVYEIGLGEKNRLYSIQDIVDCFVDHGLQVKYGPQRGGDAQITCANKDLIPPDFSPKFDVLTYSREWLRETCC